MPVLKKKADQVVVIDNKVRELVKSMSDTMRAAGGLGLAAPQVGVSLRVVVIDLGYIEDEDTHYNGNIKESFDLMVLINPEIVNEYGSVQIIEGCLSVPGYRAEVKRYSNIKVKYTDINGEEKVMETQGLAAVAIQHEIDHLNGTLFIDRISNLRKRIAIKKVKRYLEHIKQNGDEIESTLYGQS